MGRHVRRWYISSIQPTWLFCTKTLHNVVVVVPFHDGRCCSLNKPGLFVDLGVALQKRKPEIPLEENRKVQAKEEACPYVLLTRKKTTTLKRVTRLESAYFFMVVKSCKRNLFGVHYNTMLHWFYSTPNSVLGHHVLACYFSPSYLLTDVSSKGLPHYSR